MKNILVRRLSHGVLVLTVLSTSSSAIAQAPQPTPAPTPPTTAGGNATDVARQHYDRGVKLYEEEDYRAALIEFKRAYEVSPNPAVLFNIGQSYYQLVDYANALTTFEKYLAEGGNDIPPQRKTQVTSEVDELHGRVARVTITANVPDAEIYIDDVLIGRSPLALPQLLSAGRRKVTAQKQGRQPATKIVEAAGGDKLTVDLFLPDASAATRVVTAPPKTEPANYVPAYIGLGIAAVGIGVGSVFGVVALGDKSDLDGVCQNKTCPASSQSNIDALSRNATISTIGFAVGVIGLGVAVYGFVTAKPHVVESSPPPPRQQTGFRIEPLLGPGSAGISGRF